MFPMETTRSYLFSSQMPLSCRKRTPIGRVKALHTQKKGSRCHRKQGNPVDNGVNVFTVRARVLGGLVAALEDSHAVVYLQLCEKSARGKSEVIPSQHSRCWSAGHVLPPGQTRTSFQGEKRKCNESVNLLKH